VGIEKVKEEVKMYVENALVMESQIGTRLPKDGQNTKKKGSKGLNTWIFCYGKEIRGSRRGEKLKLPINHQAFSRGCGTIESNNTI
jgi:hypothetical protein